MVEVMSGRLVDSMAGKEMNLRPSGKEGFNFFSPGVGSWWAEHLVGRINSAPWGNLKKKWTRATRTSPAIR